MDCVAVSESYRPAPYPKIEYIEVVWCDYYGFDYEDKDKNKEKHEGKHKDKDKDEDKDKGKDKDKDKDKGKKKGKGKRSKGRLETFKDTYKHSKPKEKAIGSWLDLILNIDLDLGFLFADRIRYLKYPYYHDDPVYLKDVDSLGKTLAGTFQCYYLRIDHNLWGYHLSEEIKFPTGVSLEFAYTKYIEDIPHQGKDDRMGWLKWYFNCQMAENTNWILKVGLGGSHLSSAVGGLALQGVIEVFPGKPWGIHGSAGYALLEGGADLIDLELKFGLFRRRTEFTLGYRSLINSQGNDLSGPFLGWSWWF